MNREHTKTNRKASPPRPAQNRDKKAVRDLELRAQASSVKGGVFTKELDK